MYWARMVIQLPTDFEKLTVEESGEIYADGQYVDRFALVDFENYDYVEAYGENLYRAVDGATQTDAAATVNQDIWRLPILMW